MSDLTLRQFLEAGGDLAGEPEWILEHLAEDVVYGRRVLPPEMLARHIAVHEIEPDERWSDDDRRSARWGAEALRDDELGDRLVLLLPEPLVTQYLAAALAERDDKVVVLFDQARRRRRGTNAGRDHAPAG